LLAVSGTAEAKSKHKKKKAPDPDDGVPAVVVPPLKPISLMEVLDLAEKTDPTIRARKAGESAAAAQIGVARSGYLPTASFQALDTTGFPASTGYLGLGGLVGSPFRSGAAAGVVGQETIYDFGKTESQVDVAEKDVEARRQETRLAAQDAKIRAFRTFVECSRLRSEAELFRDLQRDAAVVSKEVGKFVRTGQRSIVDGYLSKAQVEEASTSAAAAEAQLFEQEKALALAIGLPSGITGCPPLQDTPEWNVPAAAPEQHPLVAAEVADLATEKARKEAIRANYRPTVNLVGALGWMEKARLVPKSPYAVGIGVNVPLFSGFKDDYELERSDALIYGHEAQVEARKLAVAEANGRFNQRLAGASAQIDHIRTEQELARRAFNEARQRYFDAQGDLTDLREAIKNLSRTNQEFNNALAATIDAAGTKALFNGGALAQRR
jgi:outer membrane protein TolC